MWLLSVLLCLAPSSRVITNIHTELKVGTSPAQTHTCIHTYTHAYVLTRTHMYTHIPTIKIVKLIRYQNSRYNGSSEFVIYYFCTPKITQESLSYIFLPVTQRHPQPYSPLDLTPSCPSLRSPLSLQMGCFPLLPLPSLPSGTTTQDSSGSSATPHRLPCSWTPNTHGLPPTQLQYLPLPPRPHAPAMGFLWPTFQRPAPPPPTTGTQRRQSPLRSAVPELRHSYDGAERVAGTHTYFKLVHVVPTS